MRDIAAYLTFQLKKGHFQSKTILKEKLWNEMHRFPELGDYGLGVSRIDLCYSDTPVGLLSHNGGKFGFGSRRNYIPEAKLAWAVFFNQADSAAYGLGGVLLDDVLVRRHGVRRAVLRVENLPGLDPSPDQLARFIGNYIGRAFNAEMKIQNGKLGMQMGSAFVPLIFTSPVDLFFARPVDDVADLIRYRYFSGGEDEVAHLECSIGDLSLGYNDGPHDPPGPGKPSWDGFLGDYEIYLWGRPSQKATVHRKNGYLYLDEIRLVVEFKPGLFFTSDGEAVDFQHAQPTWRNVSLKRIS